MSANPTAHMLSLLSGYWYSQALYVMAELGIADCLAAGPKASEVLARELQCHEATLYRFLRALAGAGILDARGSRQFALTPLSDTLRADHPSALRAVARLGGHPLHWRAWGHLLHSVRTGAPAFDAVHGRSFFDALADDRALGATFQQVMDRSPSVDRELAEAMDLGSADRVVDVGGGSGALARAIVAAYPRPFVTCADQSAVLESAPRDPRVHASAGSFFDDVPRGGDAYILKFVLHDWDDARAIRILANCRAAMSTLSRLLVVEVIVPDDEGPSMSRMHDINMLVLTGGRERRLDEYRALLAAADLQLAAVRTTRHGIGILEARGYQLPVTGPTGTYGGAN